jgi:hypothetical protein
MESRTASARGESSGYTGIAFTGSATSNARVSASRRVPARGGVRRVREQDEPSALSNEPHDSGSDGPERRVECDDGRKVGRVDGTDGTLRHVRTRRDEKPFLHGPSLLFECRDGELRLPTRASDDEHRMQRGRGRNADSRSRRTRAHAERAGWRADADHRAVSRAGRTHGIERRQAIGERDVRQRGHRDAHRAAGLPRTLGDGGERCHRGGAPRDARAGVCHRRERVAVGGGWCDVDIDVQRGRARGLDRRQFALERRRSHTDGGAGACAGEHAPERERDEREGQGAQCAFDESVARCALHASVARCALHASVARCALIA